jgi:autotransporter-associated beta strand protein
MTRDGAQKLVRSNATAFDLAIDVHAGVYPAVADWKTDLEALATARAARDAAADLAAHQAWWSSFWNRSYLHLGGLGDQARRISKYYAHQRFINACTVRGRYPTPFNGSTLTMDRPAGYPSFFGTGGAARSADYRDWDGLRIFWQNTRHIYWPLLSSGDYDMTESMARVCRDILPICRERAMVRENNPGMLLFEGIGVGGDTVFGSGVPDHLSEHRGGMTDVAILLADIYDHTRDLSFFNDTYLPWTDAVVTFFEHKFPNRDATGRMLISPSAAVETFKNSTNPATEVGPLRRILIDLLRLDPGTLTPAQRARYQGLLDIMPEPPLKTLLNQPMLGVYQTGDAGRSLIETPAHYSIWPSREAGLGRLSLLAAGRRDHASRMFSFDGTADRTFESGGWLYTPTMAAQLNLPQQAKFYALRNFLDPVPETVGNGSVAISDPYPGKPRFHAFWESRFDYIPDQCHGGSTIHGLQHMVVQSQGDKIYLFPAWPEDWDLNFKVHAAKNTVLEGVYQNGVLQSLTVTPPSRAADVIDLSTAANRVRGIVGTCVTDTNYLLGLPPMRDGLPTLPAATASAVTGSWFTQYGHTLSGGLAGPFVAADWGGSMAKGNSIFLHVLEWPGETLSLPPLALGRQITGSAVLTGGSATVNQSADGITITLPTAHHDPVVTIIRLDLDGSAEVLARHQPYVGSATTGMTASASAATVGFEAAKACDADQATSWRHGAGSGTLTIPFAGNRRLTRIDVQFDNGPSVGGQNISVTLEARSPAGSWSTLWSGTSYTQILSRPLVPTGATAVRLTTNAQGVRQIDAFSEPLGFLTWDNGAATGNWNTTDANWTGFTWNNNTPNNAVFDTSTGTIQLTEPITAGTFTFGRTNANTTGSFAGSPLAISGDLVARADGNNYPDINPMLSFSNPVNVGGELRLSRRTLEITGGSFTADRLIAPDSWGRLLISGGTVTLPAGIDDSVLTKGNTLSVILQGGTLHTPYIKTTSAPWTTVGNDGVVLNGGTLFATANSSDFIQTWNPGWGNRNNVGVGTGGARIDTNGFEITITKTLQNHGGSGSLTKSGEGKLSLTAANSYTGPTTVLGGTLSLGNGSSNSNLADSAAVNVAHGATLQLNYSGTDTVNALTFGGIARPPGVYSAANSAFITGPGTLTVSTGPATDYDGWAAFHNLTEDRNGDDDRDGMTNKDEYAFGLDPRKGSSGNPITIPLDKATGTFTYTRRRPSLNNLSYTVWTSTNLSAWLEDKTAVQTATGLPSTENQSVEVLLTPTLLGSGRLFVRVQAQ